jgi:hypothetical protein
VEPALPVSCFLPDVAPHWRDPLRAVQQALHRPLFLWTLLPFQPDRSHHRPDKKGRGMDRELIEKLARAAGLEKAWAEFPNDVASAAEQARGNKGGINYPDDPAAEPWPPMRPGTGL